MVTQSFTGTATLDPLEMLLDAARFIELGKPGWAKAARAAVAKARSAGTAAHSTAADVSGLLAEYFPGKQSVRDRCAAAILTRFSGIAYTSRDAVIEECAKVLDEAAQDWRRIRDPGMANNAAAYARRVRALAIPSTDREGS